LKALTLKFRNKNYVPSITILNKLSCKFGLLIESKTELLAKTNGVKVVFQKGCDAETVVSFFRKVVMQKLLLLMLESIVLHLHYKTFVSRFWLINQRKVLEREVGKARKKSSFVHDVSAV